MVVALSSPGEGPGLGTLELPNKRGNDQNEKVFEWKKSYLEEETLPATLASTSASIAWMADVSLSAIDRAAWVTSTQSLRCLILRVTSE